MSAVTAVLAAVGVLAFLRNLRPSEGEVPAADAVPEAR